MKYNNLITDELNKSIEITKYFIKDKGCLNLIESAANMMIYAFRNGNKILSCGNGGSHCDAMHFAGELVGRYRKNRLGLPSNSYF